MDTGIDTLDKKQLVSELARARQQIAELKRSETELVQAEARYRDLYHNVPVGLYRATPEGRFLSVNRAMVQILGYPDEETLLAVNATSLYVDVEDCRQWQALLEREGGGRGFEVQGFRHDGSRLWGENNAHAVRDESGQVAYYEGSLVDITARRQAEDMACIQRNLALELSTAAGLDETLRLCIAAAVRNPGLDAGGVYLVDELSGDMTLAFSQGLSPDFVAATSHYAADSATARLVIAGDPIYTEYQELDVPRDDIRRREGLRAIALLPVRHQGRIIACLNVASRSLGDIPLVIRGALETIAAQIGGFVTRARAEESLREAETRHRTVADFTYDWEYWVAPDGTLIYVSPSCERITGYAPERFMDDPGFLKELILPPDKDVWAAHTRAVENLEPRQVQFRIRRRDGETRWIEHTCQPVTDEQGLFLGYLASNRDITERAQADAELSRYREHLEELVEERTVELAKANESLREANLIVESSPAVLFRWRAAEGWPVELVSENVSQFGYTPEQLLSGEIPYASIVHPDDLERVGREVQEFSASGVDHFPQEYRIVTADGETRWTDDRTTIQRDAHGNITHYQGIVLDITERKRAEKELRRYREHLEELVEVRTVELSNANESLRESEEKVQQRAIQLETLREVGLGLMAQLDLDTLLYSVASRAIELLGGIGGGLYLYRPDRDVLEWTVNIGDPAPVGTILHRGEGLAGKVWETGETLVVHDYQRWEGRAAIYEGYSFTSVIGSPVRWDKEFLGVLNVNGEATHAFSPANAELLNLLATQAAIAIRNARLYEQAQREIAAREQAEAAIKEHNRALQALHEVTLDVGSELNMPTLLYRIMERSVDLLDACRGGGIYLYDADKNVLRLVEGSGINQDRIGIVLQLDEGMAGQVFQTSQPLIVNDYTNWEGRATVLISWPPSAVMGVPLLLEKQVIGVLGLFADSHRRTFDPQDILLAEMFAAQAVIAIRNARLYEQAQREITARKQAENALRESEEHYRILFEHFPIPAFTKNREGEYTSCNAENQRYWAVNPIGRTDAELLDHRTATALREVDLRIMETGKALTIEEHLANSPLGNRQFLSHKVPLRDGSGNIVGILGASLDITERKRAEDMLRGRMEQLDVLYRVAEAGSRTLELQPLLEDLLDRILDVTEMQIGAIYQLDQTTQHLHLMARHGLPAEFADRVETYVPGQGITGQALTSGQTVVCQDVLAVPELRARVRLARFRSQISLPLKVAGEIIGVLNLNSEEPRTWTPDEMRWLEAVAGQVAIATKNARLFEEIQERRMYLEGILNAAPDAIIALDARHQIIKWNPGAEKLFGYSQEQVVGQNIDDLIAAPDMLAEIVGFTHMVMSGEVLPPTESVRYRKDGSPVDVIVAGAPITIEDELIGAVGVYTDITARKRAEEEIARLATVIEQTTVTVVITNLEGDIIYANPDFETSTGYTVAEALGQNPRVLKSDRQDAQFYQELWDTITAGRTWNGVFVNKRKDGELYHEEATIFPIKDAAGEITNYAAVKQNVTERVRAEEEVRRLYEQTRRDAETKATLLKEVNHRVGNNLASLIGILNLEQERTAVDPSTYHAVMGDLANRIRGLATVHRILSATEWSPPLLSELAERVIGSALQALPRDKHVSVEVSPSALRVSPKYANSLALVLNELTTNSIKYAWPDRQSGRITVRIDRQEDMIVIEFRDDGKAYPKDVLSLERHSIGWELIQTIICHGMQGEVTLRNDRGAVIVLRYPAPVQGNKGTR